MVDKKEEYKKEEWDENWVIPLTILLVASVLLYVGLSSAEYRGQPMGNKCIDECYAAVLERREIAFQKAEEEKKLIAAGLMEAPVVEIDPTPPMWAGCAGCHGQNGEGMGMFPKIAGQSKEYIQTALTEYKNRGQRGKQSMIMWSQASLLSDNDILVLSDYIEGL